MSPRALAVPLAGPVLPLVHPIPDPDHEETTMGFHIIRCYLGFPTFRNSAAGEALEREGDRMANAYRRGHADLFLALDDLHDAIDAGLAGDLQGSRDRGEEGLRRLRTSTASVAEIATTLARSREALAELVRDGADPLAQRERWFSRVPADDLARELARASGRPEDPLLRETVATLAAGGAVAGLRAVERTAWRLLGAMRARTARAESSLALEPRRMAAELHATGFDGALLADGWSLLMRQLAYLGLVCEAATRAWEDSVGGGVPMTA